jgi:bifunctional non-homologous end joining protein LigD
LGEDAEELLRQAREIGLEGLIGKRKDSAYEPGRRSGAWIKLKLQCEQEFVIGGYTAPGGTRKHFGALLVGVYEGKELKFVGKVGTGFDASLLRNLHSRFEKIRRDTCPFANLPEKRSGRYGQTITATEMKRCRWVEPIMVCQVKFSEWTRDQKLRQPVFFGIGRTRTRRMLFARKRVEKWQALAKQGTVNFNICIAWPAAYRRGNAGSFLIEEPWLGNHAWLEPKVALRSSE